MNQKTYKVREKSTGLFAGKWDCNNRGITWKSMIGAVNYFEGMSEENAELYEIVEYTLVESRYFNPNRELAERRKRKIGKATRDAELQRLNKIKDLERELEQLKK
jgi:hypothetical protein